MIKILFCSFYLFISLNSQGNDRREYALMAVRAVPDILAYLLKDHSFTQGLNLEEREQLFKLTSLCMEKRMMGEIGVEDLSPVPVLFSDKQSEFDLADGSPIRSAVTKDSWQAPIVFNLLVLNRDTLEINFLHILQIAIHEYGHKLGQQKVQIALDSMAAKARQYLERFHSIAMDSIGQQVEVLSLPELMSEIRMGAVPLVNLSNELIFLSDKQGIVGHLARAALVMLQRQFIDLRDFTSLSSLVNLTEARIASVKITQILPKKTTLIFDIEVISKFGLFDSNHMAVDQGKQWSLRYQFDVFNPSQVLHDESKHNEWRGTGSEMPITKVLPPLAGLSQAQLAVVANSPGRIHIKVFFPEGSSQGSEYLVVSNEVIDFHLSPMNSIRVTGGIIQEYIWNYPDDINGGEFKIERLYCSNENDSLLLIQPLKFWAGKREHNMNNTSRLRLNAIMAPIAHGWSSWNERGEFHAAPGSQSLRFSLQHPEDVIEIRVSWIRGIEIENELGNLLGIKSELHGQVYTVGQWVLAQNDGTVEIAIPDLFQIKDIQQMMSGLKGIDKGQRTISSIEILYDDYRTIAIYSNPIHYLFTESGLWVIPKQ